MELVVMGAGLFSDPMISETIKGYLIIIILFIIKT